jgi:predicted ATPase/DNA-binding SARP family transcriptional activator
MSVSVEFRILGPLEVVADGEPLELGGRKQRALLALLLLHANEIVPAEVLIEELWAGAPPPTATNTLQVYVSQLRKVLAAGNGLLSTHGAGYRLALEPGQLDLHRFEELAASARRAVAAGDAIRAADLFEEALALWRGAPFADLTYEEFAAGEVRRLEELRLAAIEDGIDAELERGAHARVVPELEALVAQHPLRERLSAQLVLALYRSGRQAEALAEYQRIRHTLEDELGLDPGEELRRLELAVLNQDPALSAPGEAPPTAALPTPPTALVGREAELAAAVALARRPEVRLVTFTGPGGIGKTRLALEVARELGSTAFVDLTPVRNPDLVPPAIGSAFGLVDTGGPPVDALVELLRTRETVVLLDNFEQVVDAGPMLGRLLASAPGLKVLVTSRIVLRISGEHELPVLPLAHEAAVQLFADRAQAVDPSFRLTPETAPAVTEIAARLEGVPLAIELAAARTRLLQPSALLERLTTSLDVLASGPRDVPERQRTLRGTLDWSYDLLEVDEQTLFARLAVFIGGCSLDAVEAICDSATLALLESLVDKSLVRIAPGAEPRFAMLEILREYALEKLRERGEEETVREGHAYFYLQLAETAEREIEGPAQVAWLDRLERDHGNLRTAIAWGLEHDPALALAISGALRRFWHVHGHLETGLRLYDEALAAAGDAPTGLRVRALIGAGILAGEMGDFQRARELFERALAGSRELGDPHRIATSLGNLGNLSFYDEEYDRARSLYLEALELRRAAGLERGTDVVLQNLGLIALAFDDLKEGERLLVEALEVAEKTGGRHTVAVSLRSLARVCVERGELDKARELLSRSIGIVQEIGQPFGLAESLDVAATLAMAEEDPVLAARLFGAADGIRDSIGAEQAPDNRHGCERWLQRVLKSLGVEAFEAEHRAGFALREGATAELGIMIGNTVN